MSQCQWSNPEEYVQINHINPLQTGNKAKQNSVYIAWEINWFILTYYLYEQQQITSFPQ